MVSDRLLAELVDRRAVIVRRYQLVVKPEPNHAAAPAGDAGVELPAEVVFRRDAEIIVGGRKDRRPDLDAELFPYFHKVPDVVKMVVETAAGVEHLIVRSESDDVPARSRGEIGTPLFKRLSGF